MKKFDLSANVRYQDAKSASGESYVERKASLLGLPDLAGKAVLDLGCNSGYFSRLAFQSGACRVVGVDSSEEVIRRARAESDSAIEFLDSGWGVFPDGEFDVIFLLSAIHYADSAELLVERVRRSLGPGGLFILEGGLFFAEEQRATDIPLPAWRTVGDQALHLSWGFLSNHLMEGLSWQLLGKSERRGGDDVPRWVIHASPAEPRFPTPSYTIDLVDFFQAAQVSSRTIQLNQPSYGWVSRLPELSAIDETTVASLMTDEATFERVVAELKFATRGLKAKPIQIVENLPRSILDRLSVAIQGHA